jgi:hypothetical protein
MDQQNEENPYKSPECAVATQTHKMIPHCDKILKKLLIRAIVQTFITQFIAMCFLDGGVIAKRWALALVASWVATLMIILRYHFGRSHIITRIDTVIIKYCVYPFFIVVLFGEALLLSLGFIHY